MKTFLPKTIRLGIEIFTILIMSAFTVTNSARGQACDNFTAPNSSSVAGWTENVGDWAVNTNRLQTPTVAQWNYITYNGSTQADGYVSCRATHSGSGLNFIGVVGRYASISSYIMAKIQGTDSWTEIWVYCNGSNILNKSGSYGTDARIKIEYIGANVSMMIDVDLNGTWDSIYSATATNTSAGLCGVCAYNQCYVDDWCYWSDCSSPVAPASATATPSPICEGDTSIINATAAGSNINWYTLAAGGTPFYSCVSGADYPVSPATTTTYYAEAYTGNSLASGIVAQGLIKLPYSISFGNCTGVVWNPQHSLYYAVKAGSSTNQLKTYNSTGVELNSVAAGFDFRGAWWNPNTDKFESNGYLSSGYSTQNLDANGLALGTCVINPAGQNQPFEQSIGGYDPVNNETVFYYSDSIYRYNRTTGALVASGAITGLPSSDINTNWASYSGVPGAEIMIYDYTNRAVRFINRLTFAYAASVQLDGSALQPSSFNVAYDGNGKLWLHNGSTEWVNYQIINDVNGTTPLGGESSTLNGNARGYWFTAPVDFTITGLQCLASGNTQNIAVVRLNNIPPTYSSTTNDFATLFLSQGNPDTGVIACNIPIYAGDIIGVLGTRSSDGHNSYSDNPYFTTIAGQTVKIARLGMQYNLTTTTPQDLFTGSGSISRVHLYYSIGCASPSRTPVAVVVNPIPYAPVITIDGNTLTSDAPSGNQWYYNNTAIPGATSQTFTIITNGDYYCIVTLGGCSSDTSNTISTSVGVQENQKNIFAIYPNPVTDKMTVISSEGIFSIEVFDFTGKQLISADYGNLLKTEIDVSGLKKGIYTVRINGSIIRKIVK